MSISARALSSTSLVDRFRSVLREQPDLELYRFLGGGDGAAVTMTCAQLDIRARAIAVVLRERVALGERALILCPPGLDYVAAFFACIYAGVVAVPMYPPDPRLLARTLPRLIGVIEDATPAIVLAPTFIVAMSAPIAQQAPGLHALRWLAVDEVSPDAATAWGHPGVGGDDLAFLQYTSGSTGRPKGVMLSHANLLANLAAIRHVMIGDDPDPRCVIWLPPYHDMGLIGGLLQPAYAGFPVTFMPPLAFLKHPLRWLRAISEFRATISGGPNFAYDLCVAKVTDDERAGLDLSSWSLAFTGAEPVRAETLERFARAFAPCGFRRSAFYPCYGMAEASLLVSGGTRGTEPAIRRIDAAALAHNRIEPAAGAAARTLVGCGRPIPGHAVRVVDPETRLGLADGRVGEIWLAGPSVARGFWQLPEVTQARLAARLADTGEGPFLRTGDLGFLDNGELYVTGRLKDLIIIAGTNHYPQDIERTVETAHRALRPGAGIAFSVDTGEAEQLVVVQAVAGDPSKLDSEAIFAAIRAVVAEEHGLGIHHIALVPSGSIPKTSSGKLQRFACKQAFLDGSLGELVRSSLPARAAEPPVAPPVPSAPVAAPAGEASPIDAGEPNPSRSEIEDRLLAELAARLRVAADTLDPRRPIASYGLSSVDMVGLVGELERWLGRKLPATLAWEYPSVEAMAAFLATDRPGGASPAGIVEPIAAARSLEPVAIVGIGCRFPGGVVDPAGFWRLLCDGRDAITQVPAERWNADELVSDDPAAAGKTTTRWGGFLSGVDQFDPQFFGISPREASRMDPQQRLLAEVAWEAMEDAGLVPERLAGSPTGVFVGIATGDYGHLQFERLSQIDAYTGTGNAFSIAANRLSYLFDLRGPSMAIDTACSSSLVAVHQACAAIASGDCSLALAGGVNVVLSPALAINFSKAGAMAPDGRCKSFDARANGYVRAEGAGVVVLKPLSRAVRDRDRIYGVILGGAVNQDGRTNGLMAPNPHAQEAVLRAAYARAGVAPDQVQYVEAHGTGTLLGDPIEAKALAAVVSARRDGTRPCLIGSVKSNFGHTEAAAGIAGLIKVALMLHHHQIPGSLHYREPNPHIPFDQLSLRVVEALQPWPANAGPALAGVSSFGFGGTNAHIVLQEPPPAAAIAPADRAQVLAISAPSERALHELAVRYRTRLVQPDAEPSLAGVCNAAAVRRTHHDHRLACVGRSAGDLIAALDAFAAGEDRPGLAWGERCVGRRPRVAFVFSGQGPRWLPLGADLLDAEPVFRGVLEQCDAVLRQSVDWSLFDQLTAQPGRARWSDPGVIQPVLCAVQIALAALWRSWGVEPAAVVGHSVGEIAAAHVAGALDLGAALRVALHRGRVIRAAVGKGKMAVAGLAFDQARQLVDRLAPGLVSVAASNGPHTTVLSGDTPALEAIVRQLDVEGVFGRMLESVEFASHSPQMEPLRDELRRSLADLAPRPAAIPIVSTVTGEPIDGARLDAEYWATNLRQPVLFDQAITALLNAGHDAFVEISGHPMLGSAIEEKLEARGAAGAVVASLHRDQPSRSALLGELGQLYTAGFPIDWRRAIGEPGPMVELPSYPWQRQRCWIDEADGAGKAASADRTGAVPTAALRAAGEIEFWQAIERGDVAALTRTLGIADGDQRAALDALLPALTAWRRDQCAADAWRYRVVWKSLRDDAAARLAGTWLVVTPPGGADELSRAVSDALADHGATVVAIAAAERAQFAAALGRVVDDGAAVRGVVSLVAADEAALADHSQLPSGAALTLALVQALGDAAITAPLWLITRGAVAVGPADRVTHPGQALIWGLGRVIGLEHPERWGGLVDIGEAPDARTLERLVVTLARAHDEDQLAVRPTGRFVRRLVRAPLGGVTGLRHFAPRGTVLVTGGTGSLGVHVARWLARRGAQHLVLTNRRGRDVPGVAELEAELTGLGVRVSVVACDVADRAALAALVHQLANAGDEIRAVFHVAGDVSLVKPLAATTVAEFASVASGKDAGAQHLHELFGDGSLDAFVLFSSITGIW
ncbi:MAG TPA: SDR family NAD(P)-dependent oxidoreductase, partial [Kofleriaceae bacterium]|nr:SDR family NAD(P)-dependent oxidoreductase [Kofleriaceae bacterium]